MQGLFKHAITACLIFCVSFSLTASADTIAAYKNPAVRKFITQMVADYQFDKKDLIALFKKTQFTQWAPFKKTSKKTKKTGTAEQVMPWWKYQALFLTQERVTEGVTFWRKYRVLLKNVENTYHVPASIIVATLGIETRYGNRQGEHNALDTLTTLAFNPHRRSSFFKSELTHFLLLARQNHLDPRKIKSSYAGALGWPQFMPSSYLKYAVDYSKTGKANLFNDIKDIVASTGYYYQTFGWQLNQPVVKRANVSGVKYKDLFKKGFKPTITFSSLKKMGVTPRTPLKQDGNDNILFFELQGEKAPLYYLGFHNFYVITRYNPDKKYAMAVYELSRSLLKELNTLEQHEKLIAKRHLPSPKR